MDFSFDGDVVLDVDVLFVGTARIVPDVPFLSDFEYVPFWMSAGHFHLRNKQLLTILIVKTAIICFAGSARRTICLYSERLSF